MSESIRPAASAETFSSAKSVAVPPATAVVNAGTDVASEKPTPKTPPAKGGLDEFSIQPTDFASQGLFDITGPTLQGLPRGGGIGLRSGSTTLTVGGSGEASIYRNNALIAGGGEEGYGAFAGNIGVSLRHALNQSLSLGMELSAHSNVVDLREGNRHINNRDRIEFDGYQSRPYLLGSLVLERAGKNGTTVVRLGQQQVVDAGHLSGSASRYAQTEDRFALVNRRHDAGLSVGWYLGGTEKPRFGISGFVGVGDSAYLGQPVAGKANRGLDANADPAGGIRISGAIIDTGRHRLSANVQAAGGTRGSNPGRKHAFNQALAQVQYEYEGKDWTLGSRLQGGRMQLGKTWCKTGEPSCNGQLVNSYESQAGWRYQDAEETDSYGAGLYVGRGVGNGLRAYAEVSGAQLEHVAGPAGGMTEALWPQGTQGVQERQYRVELGLESRKGWKTTLSVVDYDVQDALGRSMSLASQNPYNPAGDSRAVNLAFQVGFE